MLNDRDHAPARRRDRSAQVHELRRLADLHSVFDCVACAECAECAECEACVAYVKCRASHVTCEVCFTPDARALSKLACEVAIESVRSRLIFIRGDLILATCSLRRVANFPETAQFKFRSRAVLCPWNAPPLK